MSGPKHFLTLRDLTPDELRGIISRANELKIQQREGIPHAQYPGKVLAMLFSKASTRTRVSFEVGMRQLGGSALFLSSADTQLGRGEPVEDTARVLSSMVDLVMIRTHDHNSVERFADVASVPVINGLTDDSHPCQIMADVMTFEEHRGSIKGKTIAYSGDGNNVVNSMMQASSRFDFNLKIAAPKGHEPAPQYFARAKADGGRIEISDQPALAVTGADCVVTDTWSSMGMEDNSGGHNTFAPYQINAELMAHANPDALFMHCLPAHRGEEVSAEVIDGPQSVVWDEAENRMHAQKALMEFLLLGKV